MAHHIAQLYTSVEASALTRLIEVAWYDGARTGLFAGVVAGLVVGLLVGAILRGGAR